jgi:serine phosphatase RsbU (regulator of sigma subunit)/PAS domain-containing protein
VTSDRPDGLPPADLLTAFDADAQGWVLARSVRARGQIVDFELVYINEAGCHTLRRPAVELTGRRFRDLWPEAALAPTMPMYRDVVDCRQPAKRTIYYDQPGVVGHFELWVGPWGDGFLARFVDLSRLTLGPRSEGGARLYEALDAAFDGFALLSAVRDESGAIIDFTCEYVNQVGAKLIGNTVEETLGRPVSEVSPMLVECGLLDRYREVAERGEPWGEQITARATGQVWEVKAVRVTDGFVAVSYRDVTEQAGQQGEILRAADLARAAAERTTALQTVTEALVAASTPAEVYAAMDAVVRPSAGGHGIVVLLVEQGRLVLHYHAGYEPDVVAQLQELPLSHQYPAAEVSVTGEPRYLSSLAEFAAAQPDSRTAISAGGRRAWAFLPLTTAGQQLGALVIGYVHPREFDPAERANLMAFSRLSAQALQRALLFQSQVSIAADLQRALLPAVLPHLNGARHAVRYLPWTRGADVGGDWYDVFQLSSDSAVVVIGDVAGHSPQAAATMGQLRNALRAYAADGHSPTGVMQRANQLLLRLVPDAVATCCYLELHLAEGTATAVLAGHPPPVLRVGARAGPLHLRTGPPLGVNADARYLDTTFQLPPGCNLLLFTDGLVEDRRYDIDRGLAELSAAAQAAPNRDPEELVEHILRADVGPHPRRDDVAILALTVDERPVAEPRTAKRRFRGDATSAAAARRFAADILGAWGEHALVDDACLLLDEVITNAVQHTVGDVHVHMALGPRLRVEVHDRSDRYPDKRPVTADSEMGRGLHIVDQLAHSWGYLPLPAAGKAVWFELDRTAGSRAP